jgi:phosphonate transport system substrate-binding protein
MIKNDIFLISFGQKLTVILLFVFLFLTGSLRAEERVTFGITGVALKEDIVTMRNWGSYIERKTGLGVDIKFARSYSEIKSMIETGGVDFAYVCGATFVELGANGSANIVAVPLYDGKAEYYSLIITKENSKINNIADLQNKVFAFSDPKSNSGTIAPAYEIIRAGYCPKSFFKRMVFTYDHGESITAVLEGFADAASVDSLVFESFKRRYPQKAKGLKIIQKFGPFPITPIVSRSGLKEQNVVTIRKAILEMKSDSEGKKILESLAVDKFVIPKKMDYSPIEKMMKFIKKTGI